MAVRKNFTLLYIAVLGCFYFAIFTVSQANAQQANNEDAYAYLIDIGDILEINVWKEPELSKQTFVRLDGRISLPLAGDVMAAGKSSHELSAVLEKKLSDIMEEPSVTVILLSSNSRKYYMVGNINSPGEYPMNTPITILQAIARAGGLGEWADKDEIIIVRSGSEKEEIIPFNYENFVKGKDLSKNITIHYGDTIIVP